MPPSTNNLRLWVDPTSAFTRANGPGPSFEQAASAQHLARAYSSALNLAGTSWTWRTVIRPISFVNERENHIISHGLDATDGTLIFLKAGNQSNPRHVALFERNGGVGTLQTATDFGALSSPLLYDVVVGFDAGSNEVFFQINNSTRQLVGYSGGFADPANPLLFGDTGLACFPGVGQEYLRWNKVLSTGEVTTLYNSGAPKGYDDLSGSLLTGLVEAWPLWEGGNVTRRGYVAGYDMTPQNSILVTAATVLNSVSQWNDQSGNSNHFIQLAAAFYRPFIRTAYINGNTVFQFDGAATYMTCTNEVLGTAFRIYIHFRPRITVVSEQTLLGRTSSGENLVKVDSTNVIVETPSGGGSPVRVTFPHGGLTGGLDYIIEIERDGAAVNAFLFGDQIGTTQVLSPSLGSTMVRLGSDGGTKFADGYIGAVLAYNAVGNGQDIYDTRDYLGTLFDVDMTLPEIGTQTVEGALTFSGMLSVSVLRTLSGSITPVSAKGFTLGRSLEGTLLSEGDIVRSFGRTLSGAILPIGKAVKYVARALSGALPLAGVSLGYWFSATAAVSLSIGPGADTPRPEYELGDPVESTVTFATNSEPADPSDVSLITRAPDGTLTTYIYGVDGEVDRINEGIYRGTINPNISGRWRIRWEGTSPAIGVVETWFDVNPSRVVNL